MLTDCGHHKIKALFPPDLLACGFRLNYDLLSWHLIGGNGSLNLNNHYSQPASLPNTNPFTPNWNYLSRKQDLVEGGFWAELRIVMLFCSIWLCSPTSLLITHRAHSSATSGECPCGFPDLLSCRLLWAGYVCCRYRCMQAVLPAQGCTVHPADVGR